MTKPSLPDCDCPVVTWILGTNDAPLVSPVPRPHDGQADHTGYRHNPQPSQPTQAQECHEVSQGNASEVSLQSLHLEK